ncbi:cyclin-dependent kinase-like 3 [Limulus polyphemus]|uniref:Cyclin-dependent kinase-like 3 n=1 Tax=Limulus polyphemus TaxID=6850 RepID=A0ABM1BP20_LIMPO|nr:cyclin-dependent kinase-like 3 [Limulus polyphemus]
MKCGRMLGKGSFGVVYGICNTDKKIALKLTKRLHFAELLYWPSLQHQNILPCLKVFNLTNEIGLVAFMIPRARMNLLEFSRTSNFKRSSQSFSFLRSWMYQILNAVHFLHDLNLYHLDISVLNVLLSSELTAQLTDFGSVYHSVLDKCAVEDIGLPSIYCPPEVFRKTGRSASRLEKREISPSSCDIYSVGILFLEVASNNCFRKKSLNKPVHRSFRNNVSLILRYLKEPAVFCKYLHQAFPAAAITSKDEILVADLIWSCIRTKITSRPSAKQLLRHEFLKEISSSPLNNNIEDKFGKNDNSSSGHSFEVKKLENIVEEINEHIPPNIKRTTELYQERHLLPLISDQKNSSTKHPPRLHSEDSLSLNI